MNTCWLCECNVYIFITLRTPINIFLISNLSGIDVKFCKQMFLASMEMIDLIHYFNLEALSMDWHLEVLYRIAVKCLKEKWIYESFKPSSNATHALKPSVSSFDWKNTPSSSQPLQLFILFTCYLWYSHLCVYLLYFPYWNDFIKGRVPIVLIFDSTNKST